jgi:hypothetical protein
MKSKRTYVYMDRSTLRGQEIARIEAETMTEADKIFQERTGKNPAAPSIGVQVWPPNCPEINPG